MIDKKSVGKRIKLIRQTKGMTLEEFGKLFSASKGNVSLWEKGSSLPSNERIKKIAAIGDITVEELLYGTQNDLDEYLLLEFKQYYKKNKSSLKIELNFIFQSIIDRSLYLGGFREAPKFVVDEEHRLNFLKDFKKYGENYINSLYKGYSYRKFLHDFPGSNLDDFQNFKHNEWTKTKEDFDKIIENYKSNFTDDNNVWINKAFTSQIDNDLTEIRIKAINEDKIDYYVNDAVQSILDEAANKIKDLNKSFDK